MPYSWSLDTSDCDSRFGDVTGSSWFGGTPEARTFHQTDFPDPESGPFVAPSISATRRRAPTRPLLPPFIGNLDDFGAYLIRCGVRLDSQPSTQASSPVITPRPLRRVNVSQQLRILLQQRTSPPRVELQQHVDDVLPNPCLTLSTAAASTPALLSPTFASAADTAPYTSSPAALSPLPPALAPAAPMSPLRPPQTPPINLPRYHARRIAAYREHLAAVRRAELASAQPATRSPRWPRTRDPARSIRILRRPSPSPAPDPLEQLEAYFSRRRALRLSVSTGLCPVETFDEKVPVAVPDLAAGLHPVGVPVAPVELPATLENHFDPDSAFVAEADSSPVCKLEAPPVAKSGFLSRVKSAVRSGLLWLAKLFG